MCQRACGGNGKGVHDRANVIQPSGGVVPKMRRLSIFGKYFRWPRKWKGNMRDLAVEYDRNKLSSTAVTPTIAFAVLSSFDILPHSWMIVGLFTSWPFSMHRDTVTTT